MLELPEVLALTSRSVLGLQVTPCEAVLDVELVLREDHPLYTPPDEDEQYCFRRAKLRFLGVTASTWRMPTRPPATDETGEADYGGIENYTMTDDRHHLVGEIGEVLITCNHLVVEFQDAQSS